jgi:hypothetical protein
MPIISVLASGHQFLTHQMDLFMMRQAMFAACLLVKVVSSACNNRSSRR